MGIGMFSDGTVTLALNVVAASILIGLVALLGRSICHRASLPLRHGMMCASMLMMLISPLPVWMAVRLGFGLFKVPELSREILESNDSLPIPASPLQLEENPTEFYALTTPQPTAISPPAEFDLVIPYRDSSTRESESTGSDVELWETAGEYVFAMLRLILSVFMQPLILIWGSVALWLGVRLIRRVFAVERLQRSLSVTSDVRLNDIAKRVFASTGIGKGAPIVESPIVPAPVTLGWLRPVIAMPQGLADALDDDELTSVCAHEVAHFARRDQFIGLLQQITATMFWWNPLLHAVNASIGQMRERVCDDFAAHHQGSGTPLARAIVRVAEWSASRTLTAPLSVALLDDFHDLADRINRLTENHRLISIRFSKTAVLGLIAFCLLLLVPLMIPVLRAQDDEPVATSNSHLTVAANGLKEETDDDALTEDEKLMVAKGIVMSEPVPISLSGHCRTPQGKPISGATVYLLSMYRTDKPLADTKTDTNGRYRFQNVALPTIQSKRISQPSGMFQVIGEAEDYGIAWHGCRYYTPSPRPADTPSDPQEFQCFQDDQIEMDLTMEAPKTLKGRIVDESGIPVANASIFLRDLDYLETEEREMHQNFRQCRCIVEAPPGYCETSTDANGQFEIHRLPEGAVAFLNIEHPDHSEQWMYVAITDKPITEYRYIANHSVQTYQPEGSKAFQTIHNPIWETRSVLTSPLNVRMESARRVTVTLVQEDGKPAPAGCVLVASSGPVDHQSFSSGETDDQGNVVLKLPPGEYDMRAQPPRKSDFRSTTTRLTVDAEPAEQSATMELALGCIVIFEVIDSASGKGIPGVSFTENIGNGAHQGISNETTRVDNYITDDNGQMRAVVFPGIRRYCIAYAEGYEHDFRDKEIECNPGTTVRLQFKLRKERK